MSATIEQPQQIRELFGGKPHRFDPETARLAALKRHEDKRMETLTAELSNDIASGQVAQKPDEYRLRRLTRVRRQLDKLDGMIQDEIDPQKLDRLASAQAKLAEQERQLSDRSLPPSLRAPTVKARQSRSGSNSMPEPTPISE